MNNHNMDTLVQKLRSHRIAVTPQRLAVLNSLETRRDHPSAEQIYQEVRRQLPAISFNTVYKTLEVFYRKGLVIKVNPLHEVARYDGVTSRHAHAICRGCHHIIDLNWEPSPAPACPSQDLAGFLVEHQSLTLWGQCPRCQRKELKEA
jgi:Fur family peroxide stress response transcriptional regulator